MKILMIAPQPFFEPRGTPFSVLGRLRALGQLEHEVDLLTYHLGENVTIPGVTILRIPAIPFIREIPIGPSWKKPFLDILIFAKAVRQLCKNRYDLLHTHEEASLLGMLLAQYFRLPHLYDMHSSLPQQLQNFGYSRYHPLVWIFTWLERRIIKTSNGVITICLALEEQVRKIDDRVPHVMIENVANEGDPEAISEAENLNFKNSQGLLTGQKIVLYTGTFEPYQGLDLFIASAERVLKQYKDVLFLLVGGKPEQVQFYQSQVQAGGLSSSIRFTGIQPPQDMPRYLRACDILISPRTSGTNTPLKIYAYLHSGKPIVATNLFTHTQVLTPEVAVLVEPDPDAMAQGILMVLENPSLATELGRQARQLFVEHYGFQTFIQKTAQILQMTLG
jgi:glycosyltransferase involved in cell wall biosynthesis